MDKPLGPHSINLVKLLLPIWGGGLLVFYGSVAIFNEDAFNPDGSLLLLIGIAIGISFLLSPWLHRSSGLVALGLTSLWCVTCVILRRHDLPLLVWGIAWGLAAYALPGLLLVRASDGAIPLQPTASRQAKAVVVGAVILLLFLIAGMFGLGIS
jgi:hypothetical protein